jgi:hypothetical protein
MGLNLKASLFVQAMKVRQQVAEAALSDCLSWLSSSHGGDVAIFDATNVTPERRAMVHRKVVEESKHMCLFIESICDNPGRHLHIQY